MFKDLKEYINEDLEIRKSHLKLEEDCIEIGGDSRLFRGLLAHYLNTTIDNRQALVCHACHNAKCSNPNHLYWGTNKDNINDQIENGTWKPVSERMKEKYSDEEYRKILRDAGKKGGKKSGGHNKLTVDIIEKRLYDYKNDSIERGRIKRLSEKWNCSHTQVRRFLNKYAFFND